MKKVIDTVKKVNKYSYVKVIQQHYGQGWEDVSEYECNSNYYPKEATIKIIDGKYIHSHLYKDDLKEYRLTGYSTRVINRKVLNV
jgi:hypothetical protein